MSEKKTPGKKLRPVYPPTPPGRVTVRTTYGSTWVSQTEDVWVHAPTRRLEEDYYD